MTHSLNDTQPEWHTAWMTHSLNDTQAPASLNPVKVAGWAYKLCFIQASGTSQHVLQDRECH